MKGKQIRHCEPATPARQSKTLDRRASRAMTSIGICLLFCFAQAFADVQEIGDLGGNNSKEEKGRIMKNPVTPIIFSRAKLVITPKPDLNGDTNGRELNYVAEVEQGMEIFPKGMIIEKELADNEAVAYIYEKNKLATLNLKNLYVSRDILFVDEKGIINEISRQITPKSNEPLNSVEKVRMVVQLAPGSVKKYNIRTGDKVEIVNQQ